MPSSLPGSVVRRRSGSDTDRARFGRRAVLDQPTAQAPRRKRWYRKTGWVALIVSFVAEAAAAVFVHIYVKDLDVLLAELWYWDAPLPTKSDTPPKRVMPARREQLDLLRAGRYAELQARMEKLRQDNREKRLDDLALDHAYMAFASADPALKQRLDDWIKAYPASAAGWAARGYYHMHLGGSVQRSAWADRTPASAYERMRTYWIAAINDFRQAITRDDRLMPARVRAYEVATRMGSRVEANYWIAAGLRLDPCSPLLHQAELWMRQPAWDGSIGAIERHLKSIYKKCPNLGGLLGFTRYARAVVAPSENDRTSALEHFDRALAYGEWPAYRFRRGRTLFGLGRYKEALVDFERALALQPQAPHILNEIAETYAALDDGEKAFAYWERALALDPYSPNILEARSRYYRRMGVHDIKYFDLALKDLEKAKLYVGNRAVLAALMRRVLTKRRDAPGSHDVLRRNYYAKPLDDEAFTAYLASLMHRFRCSQADEFRALLAHCAKTGRCNESAVRIYGLELESKLKRYECATAVRPAYPQEKR